MANTSSVPGKCTDCWRPVPARWLGKCVVCMLEPKCQRIDTTLFGFRVRLGRKKEGR